MIRPRDWTLQFVRLDGQELRTLSLGSPRVMLAASGTVLALVLAGVWLGFFVAGRRESGRIAELQERLAVLTTKRNQVNALADRLVQLEQRYGLLRDAVTEGRPSPVPEANIAVGAAIAQPSSVEPGAATLAWPLAQRGYITRTFGSPPEDSPEGHMGLDIAVPTGSYVRAIQRGRVEEVGEDPVYGRFVRIAHDEGLTSLYGHNSWLFAAVGDEVERLEVIALTGNTGRSSAPHLHLELARNGALIDPITLIGDHSVRGGAAAPAGSERK